MRALLIAGGDAPSLEKIAKYAREMPVFCADSGANACLRAGVLPDTLFGDMDSIAPETLEACIKGGCEILRMPREKDDTDTEAMLNAALQRGYKELLLLGATGGRIDHMFANLQLLGAARSGGAELVIEDARHSIRLLQKEDDICGEIGQTFSLLPFGADARAHAPENVAYPLRHLDLPWHRALGISNILRAEKAHIIVEKGDIMLVMVRGAV